MNNTLFHRGPDSDGYHLGGETCLAMRRLAIIDVAGSSQPLYNEDRSLCMVFNGELYNYAVLRERLAAKGHTFQTHGDAECILHLYEDHGEDCVTHLRGQFAFALWDEKQKALFLARDRFGEKPLFYTVVNGTFYFGSELAALYAAFETLPPISLKAVNLYLSLQYVPEPLSIYEGICKLPAGHRMVWKDQAVSIDRYWDLSYQPKLEEDENALAGELVRRLGESVNQCLVGEVPLGAHLSGGIDSSVVVALMAKSGHGRIKTFSAGFLENSFSELEHARVVAEHFGTDHHEFILEYKDIPATLTDILVHVGEPMADSSMLPLYHLARVTREHVTVALNGDGGDELFAGYLRHRLDFYANIYWHLPSLFQKALLAMVRPFHDNADKPIGKSLVNGLKRLEQLSMVDPRASILRWSSYFHRNQLQELWKPDMASALDFYDPEKLIVGYYDSLPKPTAALDRTLYADIRTYLPGDLLVKSDRMTMRHSLEGRSPFLDHELAEWAARLPVSMKIRGRTGKYLLRKAFDDVLPPKIKVRGKQGFGVPVGAWLRKQLAQWARDLLLTESGPMSEWFQRTTIEKLLSEHQSGRADHGRRIWSLVCLALWIDTNFK